MLYLPKTETEYVWRNGRRYYANKDRSIILPGTTSVLSATKKSGANFGLRVWKNNLIAEHGEEGAKQISELYLKRGTCLHKIMEKVLLDEDIESPDFWDSLKEELISDYLAENREVSVLPDFDEYIKAAQPFVESIMPFMDEVEEILAVEYPFLNMFHGYAGKIDGILKLRNIGWTINDWKTSKKRKTKSQVIEYAIQIAAYAGGVNRDIATKLPHLWDNGNGLKINQGILVFGLEGKKYETLFYDSEEMMKNWNIWLERLNRYRSFN